MKVRRPSAQQHHQKALPIFLATSLCHSQKCLNLLQIGSVITEQQTKIMVFICVEGCFFVLFFYLKGKDALRMAKPSPATKQN
jgi:hypothetical protein